MWPTYVMAFLTGLLAFHAFEQGSMLTIAAGALALVGSIWAAWYAYTWQRQKAEPPEWLKSIVITVFPFGILLWQLSFGLDTINYVLKG